MLQKKTEIQTVAHKCDTPSHCEVWLS